MNIVKILISITLLLGCSHEKHVEHNNEKYLDPYCNAEEWNRSFENKDKDTILFQKQIMDHLPLNPGDSVADVGAGTGVFGSPLSKAVGPRGKVYAVDIAPAFIPFMKERFKREGLTNIEVVLGSTDSTRIKENSVNLILVVDTYHHFDHH
jgi:ubiquinone/menaquinone biosynthesis C-methylase UbiE